jgi:hypothetical protein
MIVSPGFTAALVLSVLVAVSTGPATGENAEAFFILMTDAPVERPPTGISGVAFALKAEE